MNMRQSHWECCTGSDVRSMGCSVGVDLRRPSYSGCIEEDRVLMGTRSDAEEQAVPDGQCSKVAGAGDVAVDPGGYDEDDAGEESRR